MYNLQILSQSECDNYKDQMIAWEEERERQNVEFHITEKNINDDLRVSQERIKVCERIYAKLYISIQF